MQIQSFSRQSLASIVGLTLMVSLQGAPATAASSSLDDSKFPGGVTPSHVFGAMDQVERSLDVVLQAQQRRSPPAPKNFETGLHPMHVYQMAVACTNRTITLLNRTDFITIEPRNYFPQDVKAQAEKMLSNIQTYAAAEGITGLPSDRREFSGKTPSNVFEKTLRIFNKSSVLVGKAKISPNEVFSQMAAAVSDAQAILQSGGVAFNTSAPQPEPRRKPKHVFTQALEARKQLNGVRTAIGLPEVSLPQVDNGYRVRPIDVFVQAQILRAELSLLKMKMGSNAVAANISEVTGRTPTDVWAQVSLIGHLAGQMGSISMAGANGNH